MTRDEKIKKLSEYCDSNDNDCREKNGYKCLFYKNDNVCNWADKTDNQIYECFALVEARQHTDMVEHPAHYNQGGIECIEAIKAATVNKSGIEAVCVANVIKYLFRYETKNGLEDVKKALWYLNRLIDEMEAKA